MCKDLELNLYTYQEEPEPNADDWCEAISISDVRKQQNMADEKV